MTPAKLAALLDAADDLRARFTPSCTDARFSRILDRYDAARSAYEDAASEGAEPEPDRFDAQHNAHEHRMIFENQISFEKEIDEVKSKLTGEGGIEARVAALERAEFNRLTPTRDALRSATAKQNTGGAEGYRGVEAESDRTESVESRDCESAPPASQPAVAAARTWSEEQRKAVDAVYQAVCMNRDWESAGCAEIARVAPLFIDTGLFFGRPFADWSNLRRWLQARSAEMPTLVEMAERASHAHVRSTLKESAPTPRVSPLATETVGAREMPSRIIVASMHVDWVQVSLNAQSGHSPCFHVEDGKFCLRAHGWAGHGHAQEFHLYEPLYVAMTRVATASPAVSPLSGEGPSEAELATRFDKNEALWEGSEPRPGNPNRYQMFARCAISAFAPAMAALREENARLAKYIDGCHGEADLFRKQLRESADARIEAVAERDSARVALTAAQAARGGVTEAMRKVIQHANAQILYPGAATIVQALQDIASLDSGTHILIPTHVVKAWKAEEGAAKRAEEERDVARAAVRKLNPRCVRAVTWRDVSDAAEASWNGMNRETWDRMASHISAAIGFGAEGAT